MDNVRVGTQRRRRGRGAGLRGKLIEREAELSAIAEQIRQAHAGTGGILIVDAATGTGKSRLLGAAGDLARQAGAQVLGATASELERDFPFGVAIQLFEPRWTTSDPADREVLLRGAARHAAMLLDDEDTPREVSPDDPAYQRIHGLFWLVCNLALELAGKPLVMLIDDAHWADKPSLRFLAYLAARIRDLPVLLIVAVRTGEEAGDAEALLALRTNPASRVVQLKPLTVNGVEVLVRAEFPDADGQFCRACAEATNGNPFLVVELLAQIRANGNPPNASTAQVLSRITPDTVLHAVIARIGRMPPDAGALATAAAVLGDGASLPHAARLAGLDVTEAAEAADALAGLYMLRPGAPLSFQHPLIASAILASMTALARGAAHRRAAKILRDDNAPAQLVAAHLVNCPPEGDGEVVELLRAAARNALSTGSPETAVRLLTRALAEPPASAVRPQVVGDLAEAEAIAGHPDASQRLAEAISLTTDGHRRAQLALTYGRALYRQERFNEAADAFAKGLIDVSADDTPSMELEAGYACAASLAPGHSVEIRTRVGDISARVRESSSAAWRAALAHAVASASTAGEPRSTVRAMADLAWGESALLDASPSSDVLLGMLTAALYAADELEHALGICETALQHAVETDSAPDIAVASYCRAALLCHQGRVVEATADAEAALSAEVDDRQFYLPSVRTLLAFCHLQRALVDEAEAVLDDVVRRGGRPGLQDAWSLQIRARVLLAQHRPDEALRDAFQVGRVLHSIFPSTSCAIPWRSTCALAYLAMGDSTQAKDLAAAELELARRIDSPRAVVRALRVLGLATSGKRGIELLTEAADGGPNPPLRLERVESLVDLGGALRRANQRSAARGPLRSAIALSRELGAMSVLRRAQAELEATGARPRRLVLHGIASLTPRERRVAELAAQGLTTRQMAQSLFVTPKTVEYHLRHVYEKLGIGSRSELTEVITADASSAPDAAKALEA